GEAVELVGRQAALTVFRAARNPAASPAASGRAPDGPGAGVTRGQRPGPRAPEWPLRPAPRPPRRPSRYRPLRPPSIPAGEPARPWRWRAGRGGPPPPPRSGWAPWSTARAPS